MRTAARQKDACHANRECNQTQCQPCASGDPDLALSRRESRRYSHGRNTQRDPCEHSPFASVCYESVHPVSPEDPVREVFAEVSRLSLNPRRTYGSQRARR